MKKTKFYLNAEEQRYILHSLNALKTKLHSEGQYTDTVDDAMLSVICGKIKRVKIA
ncbi:MAG: hypothetical protein LBN22_03220 [Clostridiales Family XIII bacterium]|jgi:hypothetical protein|nr:hypothetical protein [Clostridiales Family XIII bacterium]